MKKFFELNKRNNYKRKYQLIKKPIFQLNEYKTRINNFSSLMEPESLAFISSNKLQIMSNDIYYKFRQNSNFFYLTGFSEHNSV
jgi:intermediate cleaving peptidase 55